LGKKKIGMAAWTGGSYKSSSGATLAPGFGRKDRFKAKEADKRRKGSVSGDQSKAVAFETCGDQFRGKLHPGKEGSRHIIPKGPKATRGIARFSKKKKLSYSSKQRGPKKGKRKKVCDS